MTKAVEPAFEFDDNEEGAAKSAASLGPDGGPLIAANVSYDDDPFGDDEDASWLDEDLSDEELAALGEEDFEDEDELISELDLIKESNTSIEDEDLSSLIEEEDLSADDFSLDDEFLEETGEDLSDIEAVADELETTSATIAESDVGQGAVVAAASVLPTDISDDEEFDFGSF